MAGYWLPVQSSYQWTSGYWRNVAQTETVYLPAPPATLEVGPNVAAPAADYGWSPGNWLWRDNRDDRGWEDSYRSSYQQKYDREDARPYRLWADAEKYRRDNAHSSHNRRMVAESYENYTRRQDSQMRYRKADQDERKLIERRNEDLRNFRKQRGETEGKLGRSEPRKPGEKPDPIRIKTPRSPLAGKPSKDLREDQSPPRPQHRDRPDAKGRPDGRDMSDKARNDQRKQQSDEQEKARQQDAKRPSPNQSAKKRKPDGATEEEAAKEEAKRKQEKEKGSRDKVGHAP